MSNPKPQSDKEEAQKTPPALLHSPLCQAYEKFRQTQFLDPEFGRLVNRCIRCDREAGLTLFRVYCALENGEIEANALSEEELIRWTVRQSHNWPPQNQCEILSAPLDRETSPLALTRFGYEKAVSAGIISEIADYPRFSGQWHLRDFLQRQKIQSLRNELQCGSPFHRVTTILKERKGLSSMLDRAKGGELSEAFLKRRFEPEMTDLRFGRFLPISQCFYWIKKDQWSRDETVCLMNGFLPNILNLSEGGA